MLARHGTTALAILATGALAACAGSSSQSNARAKAELAERRAEAKLAEYARCLREHGVSAAVNGTGVKIGAGSIGLESSGAALAGCARLRSAAGGRVNASPQQRVEQEERGRRFAKCMRGHGINVPNPKILGAAAGNQEVYLPGLNLGSPAVQSAAKACGGGPKG
jgi:hypothetical protein